MYNIQYKNAITPNLYQNLSTLPTYHNTTINTTHNHHCFPVQSPDGAFGPPESAILNKL